MVKLDNNYETWRRVGKEGIFKEDKYYVSDNNSSTDTTRDMKMVTEASEGNNTFCKWAGLTASF